MARIDENAQGSTVTVTTTDVEPVPTNVVTLSSGVRVQFIGKLPTALTQQIVVNTFQDANLDKDGQVRADMSNIEQLKLAKKMFDYNISILTFALSMKLVKLYDGLPKETTWLEYLKLNPLVSSSMPNVDFNSKVHQELLYMIFVGFANDADLEQIGNRLLNR